MTPWTKLRLTGASVIGVVDLPIKGASPSDMFVLKGVDGLGPAEIDVSISGDMLQALNPRNKQIVARIGLNPDYTAGQTPADLRSYIYGMLTGGLSGPMISTIVMDGTDELFRIDGYISKLETAIFSKDPEVQLTIEALSPYFRSPVIVSPKDNGDFAANVEEISFLNQGSAPAGFMFYVEMNTANKFFNFRFLNDPQAKQMEFDYFSELGLTPPIGSQIRVNTTPGQRSAFLYYKVSPGVYQPYDLMSSMTEDSSWLMLHNDLNEFEVHTVFPIFGDPSITDITWIDFEYLPLHWGV